MVKSNRMLLTSALTAFLSLGPAFAQETQETPAEPETETGAAISESVQDEATAQVDERRKALIDDATLALEKTEEALKALDNGDEKAALEALAIATGKLELVVARDPALALAPVDVNLITRDFASDLETIKASREAIEDLVDDGRLQEARPLMRAFASELIVETSNLPLWSYPAAIKRASAKIHKGDIEAAKRTIATALSTIVVTEEAIALPVLKAELFLQAAESSLEDPDEPSPDAITPETLVAAARGELEIAEALGYGDEDDYAHLHESLDELDEKIEEAQDAGGVFDTIAQHFSTLKERLFGDRS